MAPLIHLVRHGQGCHNVGAGAYTLEDPLMTLLGQEQCEALREAAFPDQSKISLVMASPLSRALQTAFITFKPALRANGKCAPRILAVPDAQETSDDPCDIGTCPALLPDIVDDMGWPVDLSLVEEGYNDKSLKSRFGPHDAAIRSRARDLRRFLAGTCQELAANGAVGAEIVLVSHGSFLHYLTDDWEDAYLNPGTGWRNCETRSYTIEHDLETGVDDLARLFETKESRRKRGKVGPMYGRVKQEELFSYAMDRWGEQGLQRPDMMG